MEKEQIGTVSVAPEVLASVATASALAVPGVVRLSRYRPVSMERLLRRVVMQPGVSVAADAAGATVDLYLVFASDVNLLEVGRLVQAEVARAIRETVGFNVREVNIHVDDISATPEKN